MAAKKKHTAAPRRRAHHGKKKTTKRRRRMGAGSGAFKALSDPIIGGLAGLIVGRAAKNMLKQVLPENMKPYAGAAVALVAYSQRKKLPYVAGAAGGDALLSLVAGMKKADGTPLVPFLSEVMEENDNVRFADPNILAEDFGKKEPLILSEQSYRIEPINDGAMDYAPFSYMDEDED